MPHHKTQLSDVDRRRFLRHSRDGVTASIALALLPGRDLFAVSDAIWNIVGQQLLLAELEHASIQENDYWNDAWDGYPLARKRLLTDVVTSGVRNPVFLTGDWHSTFVNDLTVDFQDPNAPTVATEFVTPAITTGGDGTPYGPYYRPMIPFNPQHQVLRRRPPWLLQGDGHTEADAPRPAIRHECRELARRRLRRSVMGRAGRSCRR